VNKYTSYTEAALRVLMWIACAITFIMMMHITVDVALRVLFNAPLVGTFEVASAYYMVAVMFLPLAYVSRHEGQIVVELFTRNLKPRTLFRWDAAVHFITIIYLLFFTWNTGEMAAEQTKLGEVWEAGEYFLHVWPSRWIMPISFGVMAAYLLVRMVQDFRKSAGD